MELFRFFHQFPPSSRATHHDTLETQWRMHPALGEMVSRVFYGGRAVKNPVDADELEALARRCSHSFVEPPDLRGAQLVWMDFDTAESERLLEETRRVSGEIENQAEKRALVAFMRDLRSAASPGDIAILSPYRLQVESLKAMLDSQAFPNQNLADRVFTVDSFQGRQAATVVISLVRNNRVDESRPRAGIGFLGQKERATVMFSRAEKLLIVLGCSGHFKRFPSTSWIFDIYERAAKLEWWRYLPAAEREKIAKIKSRE
jgi:superfamily I DNA and/or RNA helicase